MTGPKLKRPQSQEAAPPPVPLFFGYCADSFESDFDARPAFGHARSLIRTLMEAAPYFLTLAAVCAVFSYGLMHRSAWMWRLGWIVFYLFAAKFGEWFFTALREAQNGQQVVWACIYLAGGLVLWYPYVVWWSRQRRTFGIRDDIPGPPTS